MQQGKYMQLRHSYVLRLNYSNAVVTHIWIFCP